MSLKQDGWLSVVENFGKIFKRAAGSPDKLEELAKKHGQTRIAGMIESRAAFT